jgi:16S rRNA G966 N2-methylase RsmD
MDYYIKYLKYKSKYIELKNKLTINSIGGYYNKIEYVRTKVLKKVFPEPININNFNYRKLQLTTEGLFSVSRVCASTRLVNFIKKYMNNNTNITITDATSNNGSDTINLALNFNKVNAIEIDPINYKVLLNNIETYKLKNVDTYNEDSLDLLNKLKQDIIYIDAPWGGPDYKLKKNINLYLSNYEISDIYNKFKDKCKIFIFKVPFNYNFNNFPNRKRRIRKINCGIINFYFIIMY